MKFGKSIQKKQLEIPEYAASFVDYKALKKLIKELKNSPVTRPGSLISSAPPQDSQLALQANRGSFFFRLDRELDKVNVFYTVKESESHVRLRVLIDKQKSMRMRHPVISRSSSQYITLEQGFRDFIKDLSKLQQFIEINATAFSKILKKWDKTSKSQTKEQYLSRAVEIQPVFNRNVIGELSDEASTSLLDCAAWAEGETARYEADAAANQSQLTPRFEQFEADSDLLESLYRGDIKSQRNLLSHLDASQTATDRATKAFLTAVSEAPEAGLDMLIETGLVDFQLKDEINDRNCLHKAAMTGRSKYVRAALANSVDPRSVDAYGRIPLHYASMNGHVAIIEDLVHADRSALDAQDLDNFTALIHAIVHNRLASVQVLLKFDACVDQITDAGHIPLNLACQHGSFDIIALLLQKKPSIVPDAEGLYPQHLVARFGTDARLLLLLRENGADLNQADKLYNWTPLFHAASEGRVDCLQALLDCGADTSAKDEKGQSALYYATWEGHLECMFLLSETAARSGGVLRKAPEQPVAPLAHAEMTSGIGIEQIPDLSLPPPIIPTRRYGHSYLENKSTVLVMFGEQGTSAVKFYDESKYPAARLTITPRSIDILPRNLLLPIQEDNKCLSFETDSLGDFALEFDIYPTFGKKVIAKGSVPPDIFRLHDRSSGHHYLSLFDPRLRVVGQMSFKYQIIEPFRGLPLDRAPFATYWKATSQLEDRPSSFVTGSSLFGEYVRVAVQSSQDAVPIAWPSWTFTYADLTIPASQLTASTFQSLQPTSDLNAFQDKITPGEFLGALHQTLSMSHSTLEAILDSLPSHVNLEIHIMYPTEEQERALRLGPLPSINDFADAVLDVMFRHTYKLQADEAAQRRSIVMSSYNADLCAALNWKQPNYPVLLCNDLGAPIQTESAWNSNSSHRMQHYQTTSDRTMSIKEAVRIASSNNLMGITCRADLLRGIPALIEAIKEAGLVLVADASSQVKDAPDDQSQPLHSCTQSRHDVESHDGIDGLLRRDGTLSFQRSMET